MKRCCQFSPLLFHRTTVIDSPPRLTYGSIEVGQLIHFLQLFTADVQPSFAPPPTTKPTAPLLPAFDVQSNRHLNNGRVTQPNGNGGGNGSKTAHVRPLSPLILKLNGRFPRLPVDTAPASNPLLRSSVSVHFRLLRTEPAFCLFSSSSIRPRLACYDSTLLSLSLSLLILRP
jgi:hypothetical protein